MSLSFRHDSDDLGIAGMIWRRLLAQHGMAASTTYRAGGRRAAALKCQLLPDRCSGRTPPHDDMKAGSSVGIAAVRSIVAGYAMLNGISS